MEIEFESFPKIARLNRECVITEKIDGTNAQIIITEDGRIAAASRSRLITPSDDNFGFAAWVETNKDDLLKLGPGRHFGEWWGSGIQRRYGLDHKRFSLFNVSRWGDDIARPACCHVVPILVSGLFHSNAVESALDTLREFGSCAAHGFLKPEGIIVWHEAARTLFKVTLEKDDAPKTFTEGK